MSCGKVETKMILMILCFTGSLALVDGLTYSCPTNHVLAVASQNDNEIDASPTPLTICGQARACAYSKGPACLNKGQYVSGVKELQGNILHGCCQVTPPVDDHQQDDCHDVVVETGGTGRVSVPRPPPIPTNRRPPSAGAGGSGSSPMDVLMEQKAAIGLGQLSQLIKSIRRIDAGGVKGYIVKVCTPQCGRTTATTRTPPTQKPNSREHSDNEPPVAHHKKGLLGGQHCFSNDMTVSTPYGTKRMDKIRAGDQVLVTTSNSKLVYEPVEWLYHRDPNAEADFVTVKTKSNRILRLSANHLIPITPCSTYNLSSAEMDQLANLQSFFARRLKIGQCVAVRIENEFVADEVVDIARERKRGIYSPITDRGTIIVNDMYVSCYSSFENHLAQKAVHSSLIKARKMVSKMWNFVFGSMLAPEDSEVPVPLKMLLKLAQLVAQSNVYDN